MTTLGRGRVSAVPRAGRRGAGRLPRVHGFELPVLRVALVPTPGLRRERGRPVRSHAAAARILAPFLAEAPAACRLATALLDARERLRGVALFDGAGLSACCLRPSEVFAPAIVAGAAGVYLAHRHRWSDPCGSRPDFVSTELVEGMGRELGLHVHDHLIFDARGRYASLRDAQKAWCLWRWHLKHTPRLTLPVSRPANGDRASPAARPSRARRRLTPPRLPAERTVP